VVVVAVVGFVALEPRLLAELHARALMSAPPLAQTLPSVRDCVPRVGRQCGCEDPLMTEESQAPSLSSDLPPTFVRTAGFGELLRWWEVGPDRPAVVTGGRGSGKSSVLHALVAVVAQRLGDPSAAQLRQLHPAEALVAEEVIRQLPAAGRAIVAFDEADLVPREAVIETVQQLLAREPRVAVALAAHDPEEWPEEWMRVSLGPLSTDQASMLAKEAAGPEAHGGEITQLVHAAEGSPLLVRLLAERLRQEPAEDVLALLREQRFIPVYPSSTLFPSPDLYPGGAQPAAHELDVRVSAVNDELIGLA
jgi:hypothetical protein